MEDPVEIDDVLARYINLIDAGDRSSAVALLDQYPQYADELNSYLSQASSVNRRLEDTSASGKVTVAVSDPAENFPREFGKYRLLRRLGAGAMGVVYEACDSHLNRVVALKLLPAHRNSPNSLKRFQIEAQTAAKLIHPNIVRIYEVGEIDSQAYFTMDRVVGFDLKQLADGVGVAPQKAAQYAAKIARATHFAHEQGVLHRDIKPSNILLEKETDQPLVGDFGLAKNLIDPSELTMTNEVIGSPAYLAPELIGENRADASVASDIYSIGATLYHLLSGMPPCSGDSVATVLQNVMLGNVPSLRSLNRSIPRDLATICEKCMERDPRKRYATPLELAEDLERYLRREPIQASPISAVVRGWRWCQRRPAQAALVSLGCLLLVGATLTAIKINGLRQVAEARRVEAEQKAKESDDLANLLIGIFGSPEPQVSGRDITVADQLDLAMRDPRFTMKDQPLRRAAFLLAIGKTYSGLDVIDKARKAFEEAEAIYAEQAGHDKERLICQFFSGYCRSDSQDRITEVERVKKQWERNYSTESKE
ncbi:MAG: serine/threonine-protein kinase [Planctomycetota bacterium]